MIDPHMIIGQKPCGCALLANTYCIHDKEFQKRMRRRAKSLMKLFKKMKKQEDGVKEWEGVYFK